MGHRTYRFSVESAAPPEAVIAAATDFTERRLHYWSTIAAKRYKVHSIGDNVADVTEGEGPVWTRSRYEWTDDIVRAVGIASNAESPGDYWQMRVTPRQEGGCRIDIELDLHWHGIGLIGQFMAGVLGVDRFFARDMRETVRRIEADEIKEGVTIAEIAVAKQS